MVELLGASPPLAQITGGAGLILLVVFALAGLAALARRRDSLVGTTLIAPAVWSLVALTAIVGCELVVRVALHDSAARAAPLRFAAAMSAFCPGMALLGAKRPQNRGWQFIVLSLWVCLSIPAGKWLLQGGMREIHPAWLVFIAILIGTTWVNALATRYWFSGTLVALGQAALVAPFFGAGDFADWAAPSAIGLWSIAWWLVALAIPRGSRPASAWDQVWLDFRDAFGLVWSLRVAERFNHSAITSGWPLRLTWSGFRTADNAPAELPPAGEEVMKSLLWRFVSHAWIELRLSRANVAQVASTI